ncbi:EAL and HDOD domain-containing protein [Rheinheimera sp.]|uniref:EAL and HDOD domain-containing protein n=1 Tax=Rheinheimera sp. TaxID=1869214 RepID=UPI002736923D|nr:HDOD domain-containing protein [Rheinheimera sp.]MDP2713663.1 HDOD domain-containing protein [Rheinheimera sp.]
MTRQTIDTDKTTDIQQLYAAQPIFDRKQKRYAIALLNRSGAGVSTLLLSDAGLCDAQLQQLCADISAQSAVYKAPLFVALAADFVLSGRALPLAPDTVVLEPVIPPQPDATYIGALKTLKKQGFRLALHDIALTEAAAQQLLPLADIVRLNVLNSNLADTERYKAQFGRPGLLWLAEPVETDEQFAIFKALGCDLFQGYFLTKSLLVAGKKMEPSALKVAEIISCLFAAEPDIAQLSALLKNEPNIVMGLLKIANSPLYRRTRAVSSVKETVTRLGLELTRKWLLMCAVLSGTSPAAAITVLTRAYTAQHIAQQWQLSAVQCQQYFLAALISGTDLLFDIPSELFLRHVNLHKDIKAAIKGNRGRMAGALAIVRSIERGYALKLAASDAELPYIALYNQQLSDVQQRLLTLE